MFKKVILYTVLFSSLLSANAFAAVDDETAYALNTLLFLISGFLVMWMAAGFCMLESGLVTSKSVSTIAAKNIGLYSIAGIMFWLVGIIWPMEYQKVDILDHLQLGVTALLLLQVILMDQIGFFKWFSVQQQHQLFQEH